VTVKRGILYLVCFMGALVLFAFLRFPHQAAAWKISGLSERLFPGVTLEMDRVTPCFPPGLCAEESMLHAGVAGSVILDDLCLYGFFGILFPEKQVRFTGNLAGGEAHGKITGISSAWDRYDTLDLTLTGLQVTQMTSRLQGTAVDLSFDLNGVCSIRREKSRVTGSGEMMLTRVTGSVQSEFMATHDLASVVFDQVAVAFVRENEQITLSTIVATGRLMTVRLQGLLVLGGGGLSDGLDNWYLDLSGSVNPQAAYVSMFAGILSLENLFKTGPEKGIPIRIFGPVTALEMTL
jgi:type II secretion system protein N